MSLHRQRPSIGGGGAGTNSRGHSTKLSNVKIFLCLVLLWTGCSRGQPRRQYTGLGALPQPIQLPPCAQLSVIRELKNKVQMKDSRALPALIRAAYEAAGDADADAGAGADDAPSSSCILSCLSVLDAGKGGNSERKRTRGMELLSQITAAVPHEHLLLATLGLECMFAQDLDGEVNVRRVDLAALPSPDAFRRELGLSQWLAWPHLERLRAGLMQQSGATGANRDVIAVAVVEAFIHDRRIEMRLLGILEQAPSSSVPPVSIVSEASSLLDEIVQLGAPLPLPLAFLARGRGDGTSSGAERWLRGLDWSASLRPSAIFNSYLGTDGKPTTVAQALLKLPPLKTKESKILCLGDGDFSQTLALHDGLAREQQQQQEQEHLHKFNISTSSLLSRDKFCRMYREGARNIEDLVHRGVGVQFELDVHCTPSSLEADVVVFLFPISDAKMPKSGQWDTFYVSTGRHQELLSSIFAAAAKLNAGRVVLSLLMSQAVRWEAQRLGADAGFQLTAIHAFDTSSYAVRRSWADATFPHLASAHLFIFCCSSSKV